MAPSPASPKKLKKKGLEAAEANASDDASNDARERASDDASDHDVSELGRFQCFAVFAVRYPNEPKQLLLLSPTKWHTARADKIFHRSRVCTKARQGKNAENSMNYLLCCTRHGSKGG